MSNKNEPSNETSFELGEVLSLFDMKEEDCRDKDCDAVLRQINQLTQKYGREYVIKKIALKTH
ncbi:MAG: hypothetical protein H0S80_00455 [Desulfovibrionaceae bacterium]|nr:hypothetical protein [Desulfovibrionaceae bacterium]